MMILHGVIMNILAKDKKRGGGVKSIPEKVADVSQDGGAPPLLSTCDLRARNIKLVCALDNVQPKNIR